MERVTYAWMRDKRLPYVSGIMRDAGMLAEGEAIEIDQTGGTKFPYRLVLTYNNGAAGRAQTRLTERCTIHACDQSAEAFSALAWRKIGERDRAAWKDAHANL